MELAYLISEYPARSHTFIRREIAELRRRGATIHVLAIRKPDRGEMISEQDWHDYDDTWSILPVSALALITVHAKAFLMRPLRYVSTLWASFRHRHPGMKNALWGLFHFAEAILVASELENRKVRHLHIHFANAGANIGYLVNCFVPISWSMNLHGACDFEYPAGPLLGQKLESCSFSNCASYYGKAQAYRAIGPEHWPKLFVSRCGVEPNALPERPDKSSDAPTRIVCVGRFSSEKGHLGLIDACAIVFRQIDDIELVLVGDGPDRNLIERRIAEHGIEDRITLTGNVAEYEALEQIAQADLFALPSLMEGIPLVLMEAMASEVPVVAPRLAGIPELVEDEVNGLLYHPGHWQQMAEQIKILANNPKLRQCLGEHGKQKVLDEFSVNKAVEPLWQRLEKVVR